MKKAKAYDGLLAESDRLRAAMHAVEYSGEAGACPSCAGKPHMDSCDLAAALHAAQEPQP